MSNRSHRVYWVTWAVLLALSLIMIGLDGAGWPRTALVIVLLGAMLAKAALIAANFMHLRFEPPALVAAVALGILATSAALFVLIAVDGLRIFELSRF